MSPRRGQIHYAFSPRFSSSTLLFLFSPSLSLSSLPCLYIKLTNVRLRFSVVRYRSLRDTRKSLLFSVQMTDNFFLFRDFPLSLSLSRTGRKERRRISILIVLRFINSWSISQPRDIRSMGPSRFTLELFFSSSPAITYFFFFFFFSIYLSTDRLSFFNSTFLRKLFDPRFVAT